MILLDGFDEVGGTHKESVAEFIETLQGYSQCMIITSRHTNQMKQSLRETCLELTIASFRDDQKDKLLENLLGQKKQEFVEKFNRMAKVKLLTLRSF